jgi:hypothetical protein
MERMDPYSTYSKIEQSIWKIQSNLLKNMELAFWHAIYGNKA